MRSRWKLTLGLSLPLLLAAGLLWFARGGIRPRAIFQLSARLVGLQISAQGQLCVIWLDNHDLSSGTGESVFDTSSERLLYQRKAPSDQFAGWDYRLMEPLPDGRRVVQKARSENLEVLAPNGKVISLPPFTPPLKTIGGHLLDLHFVPGSDEILALNRGTLFHLDLMGRKPPRKVRVQLGRFRASMPGIPPAWSWEVGYMEERAAISPDGKYIAGFHGTYGTNGFLEIYDSSTGNILRHIPISDYLGKWNPIRETHLRWLGGGEYILLERLGWLGVKCIDWKRQRVIHQFSWPTGVNHGPVDFQVNRTFLTPDNRFYCDLDGQDIVVRDCVSGRIARRARQAAPTGTLPPCLAAATDGEVLYFQPQWRNGDVDRSIWRWPTVAE